MSILIVDGIREMKKLTEWFRGHDVISIIEVDHKAGKINFRDPRWQLKLIVAWYDLWVGVFIDREKRKVYFFPIPCVGLVFYWG